MPDVTIPSLTADIQRLAEAWAPQRAERQRRRALDRADFDALRDAGYLLCAVPADLGGLWRSVPESTRFISELLRLLARSDSSAALVAAMHPAVLQPYAAAVEETVPGWLEQRRWIYQTVIDGGQWGTIVSEPGSGGNSALSKAELSVDDKGRDVLSGRKHFGSGSGVTSYMITNGLSDSATAPSTLFLDVRDALWDGSTGMKLIAEWEGHGMAATQSHSFQFDNFPVIKCLLTTSFPSSGFIATLFSAVILGVAEAAMATARDELGRKRDAASHYTRSEWSQAELEEWQLHQCYEGMLRECECEGAGSAFRLLQGKTAMSQLAESLTLRLTRIMGGSTFGRGSPYGFWFEDVRALGFLRPPWVLAFDNLWAMSWAQV
jgi:alkylation response protein AidB-like acyl-CoA dehydrogenase